MSSGPAARPRRAARAVESSDVRRWRGFVPAALAGALSLLAALLLVEGPARVLAPGPLARPHAELACSSCHAGAEPQSACASCHGGQASRRPGHAELSSTGALECARCHAVHRAEEGLAFEAGGRVIFYGAGFEHELGVSGVVSLNGERATLVPLVRESACTSCHRRDDPRDPAAHCFARGKLTPPAGGFALCFDEHRRVATRGGGELAERDAAVEAARLFAQTRRLGLVALVATAGPSALYLCFGLAVCFGALSFGRRLARRRERARARPPLSGNVRRLPVIDAARCLGCEACVDACPYDALEVRRYVAVLARPDDCCGAGPCEQSCPNGSLTLGGEGAPQPGPRLSPELESPDRPGLFVAGDATGSSLIRNAVRQGVAVAETVAARAALAGGDACAHDLIVVGAGPAGLAAALVARARGLDVVVLEQASIAESIRRFSRGKLVLDTPEPETSELPLFVADATKEELLGRWLRTVRKARLEVREGARVVEVTSETNASGPPRFSVRVASSAGDAGAGEHRARFVLLAIGSRGTPRKLPVPVPGTLEARVHYELSDARAFAGRRAVVLGLGDVAMESALALVQQPGTQVTIVHRGGGFRRGKQRNIDALSAAVARGRIEIYFRAEVECVEPEALVVRAHGERRRLPFDVIFVHIGALPAGDLLGLAGVRSRA